MMHALFDSMVELITRTSTELPPDVRVAMKQATGRDAQGSRSSQALAIINENIDLASSCEGPICQDTGMPTFKIRTPVGVSQLAVKETIRRAVAEATRRGKLRPNSVDSITGENSGDNLGPGTPILYVDQWDRDDIEVKLILKGGGCENTNAQYALPTELPHLGKAGRDLDGVRKCILHAVWAAQGRGCSPGAVGVCVGGDRTSGYSHAKDQLFRTLYDCWAYRRLGVIVDATTGAIREWLYRNPSAAPLAMVEDGAPGFVRTGNERVLQAPISEATIRSLSVGDVVLVRGRVFTGRDAVHAHLVSTLLRSTWRGRCCTTAVPSW